MDHHSTPELDYLEWDGKTLQQVRRPVVAETPWVLYLDGHELLTLMCSPAAIPELAIGFLASEGLIASLEDLWQLRVYLDEHRVFIYFPAAGLREELRLSTCPEASGSIVAQRVRPGPPPEHRVRTSGCGGGVSFSALEQRAEPLESNISITIPRLLDQMRALNYAALSYRRSRGIHTSALSDGEQLLLVAEDVGRHNTLDKLRGAALLAGLDTTDLLLLSSGRISTEMLTKARAMRIPIIASRTSPTASSVRLAAAWGITLVGYARPPQLRIYTWPERIRQA